MNLTGPKWLTHYDFDDHHHKNETNGQVPHSEIPFLSKLNCRNFVLLSSTKIMLEISCQVYFFSDDYNVLC